MRFFNFPGQQDHRTFNYRPIYYDKDEEERKRVFGKVDGSLEKEQKEGKYVPGSYIKGSLRNGNYEGRRSSSGKFQTIIGWVGIILLFVILIFFTKFFSLL